MRKLLKYQGRISKRNALAHANKHYKKVAWKYKHDKSYRYMSLGRADRRRIRRIAKRDNQY